MSELPKRSENSAKTAKTAKVVKAEKAEQAVKTEQADPTRLTRAAGSAPSPGAGRLSVLKTYKLYVGGKFPRSESGRVYEVTDSKRHLAGERAAAPPARTRGTRWSPRARRSAAGRAPRPTTAARSSTASPRCWRAAASSSYARSPRPRAVGGPGRRAGRRGRRPLGLVRGLDRQDRPGRWAARNPVAGPYFNLSTPEPTGVVAVLAPQESSFLGLVSVLAPVIVTGNTAVRGRLRTRPAARPVAGRGAGHLRPARRRGQRPLRTHRARSPPRSPPTRTSTRST